MDQQHSAIVKHVIKVSAVCQYPILCPRPKSSLINRLINDHLLDSRPTVIQTSPQLISILQRILIDTLLYCC